MEPPILPNLTQQIVKTSPPNTSTQIPTFHNDEVRIATPHSSSTHLLSPFRFQPETLRSPNPYPDIGAQGLLHQLQQSSDKDKFDLRVRILHTFNGLFSIPAMPATHPMVLELRQQPLDPQLQLEHDLRVFAIQERTKRHDYPLSLTDREKEENAQSEEEEDGFEWQWNILKQDQDQENPEGKEHKKRKGSLARRALFNHVHTWNGSVVKPSRVVSTGGPGPWWAGRKAGPVDYKAMGDEMLQQANLTQTYNQGKGEAKEDGEKDDAEEKWRRWAEMKNNNNNNNDKGVAWEVMGRFPSHMLATPPLPENGTQGVNAEAIDRIEGISPASRSLLGQVPPSSTAVANAGNEAMGDVEFEAGPWEEIGRQWARLKPWELPDGYKR
ncbi:MAG: hypothetical protein LQ337_000248 [Flavoplaca oasis]|nr:MAG: hypothetical protein LQ337_000248 [Flavoplaca oasis]